MACHYLTTDAPWLRKELMNAIDKNNSNLNISLFSLLFFIILAILILYSYSIYREVNNHFYEFKKMERKYQARQLHKNSFKYHDK